MEEGSEMASNLWSSVGFQCPLLWHTSRCWLALSQGTFVDSLESSMGTSSLPQSLTRVMLSDLSQHLSATIISTS